MRCDTLFPVTEPISCPLCGPPVVFNPPPPDPEPVDL